MICQNDDQHSRDTTESEGVPEEVAVKKDEYVYRLLRFNECFRRGLRPKNIHSKTSLKRHVENGSNKGEEIAIHFLLQNNIRVGGIGKCNK